MTGIRSLFGILAGGSAPLLIAPFLPFPERVNQAVLRSIPVACTGCALFWTGLGPALITGVFLGAPYALARIRSIPDGCLKTNSRPRCRWDGVW